MVKVFISWSGDKSKALAEQFHKWLPGVIQAVHPYFSPDDVAKGARWNTEISKELDSSQIGIICLTRDNLDAPWLMFEAGALSKNMERSKVCPIVFGLSPTDLKDPLAQFQCARFEKLEVKKIVKMANAELGENGLAQEVLDSVFEMWWPKLDAAVSEILGEAEKEEDAELRSDRDLLEEILALSRRSMRSAPPSSRVSPGAVRDLVEGLHGAVSLSSEYGFLSILEEPLQRLMDPIAYLIRRVSVDSREGLQQSFIEVSHILRKSKKENGEADEAATEEESS
jgi:hypothetical protein